MHHISYDGLDLHTLGELRVTQSTDYEGGENPTRRKRTFSVTVDVFEDTFAANYTLLEQLREKLKVQHGILLWKDTDTNTVYVELPAVISSEDVPDDPNAWGRYQQSLNIAFTCWEQDIDTKSAAVTLTAGTVPIELAQMMEWRETLTTERFSALRPDVKFMQVRVAASGVEYSSAKLTPEDRRAALQTRRDTWRTALETALQTTTDINVESGTFNRAVRLESFDLQLDQSGLSMPWNFGGFYNVLPAEGGYAIADYRVGERNGDTQPAAGNGEQFLTISGTVMASDEAAARTRINAIRAAQITARGYAQGQILRHEIEFTKAGARTTADDLFTECSFTIEIRKWRADNMALTITRTGSSTAVNFGQVSGFGDGYSSRRFDEQRSQRSQASGKIDFKGRLWLGSVDTTVAARRALVKARLAAMHDAVNGADAHLVYGDYFDGTVRIEDFQPQVDQELEAIEWTLSASYSKFPNEAGYATVEMQAEQSEDVEAGDVTLQLSGTIRATDATTAVAKLEAIRATALAQYGYAATQQVRAGRTEGTVSANGDKTAGLTTEADDGTTFLVLQFSESYRKRMTDLKSWNLQVSDTEENREGFFTTSYAGEVVASGADVAAAYAAALAKAEELGANKHDFPLRSNVVWTQRQTRAEATVEFVRLQFSYEYQRKGGAKAYVEMSSSVQNQRFGSDSESISGSVSAADMATARGHYETLVKAGLAGRLILDEDVTEGSQRMQNGAAFVAHFVRLEFRLSVHRRRAVGTESFRYAIDTEKDWLELVQRSTVSGTCFASTEAEARSAVNAFLSALNLGKPVLSREGAQTLRWNNGSAFAGEHSGFDFEEVFEKRITGESGILACDVTEEVEYASTRWIKQPLPRNPDGTGGVTIMQDAGLDTGQRTVRGSVKAATKAIGLAWADKQRLAFLSGPYTVAPRVTTQFVFAPRTEGVTAGSTENVRVVLVSFEYGEILPELAYVPPAP